MGNLSISVSAYERTRDNYISIIQGQASKTKDALKTLIENGYDEKMGICIEGRRVQNNEIFWRELPETSIKTFVAVLSNITPENYKRVIELSRNCLYNYQEVRDIKFTIDQYWEICDLIRSMK